MRAATAFVLLILPACYVGPKFALKDKKASCPAATGFERGYDLAMKVDQGPGDGTFAYDQSDWLLMDRTSGAYDLKTGDFWWLNEFTTDAMRVTERAEGAGFISRNGDLDLEYVQTAVFRDETVAQTNVRHMRAGCTEVVRLEPVNFPDDVVLIDATWTEGALDWQRNFVEGPSAVVGVGRVNTTRAWTETVDHSKGAVQVSWFTEGDGNGHQTRTFDDDNGYDKTVGTWERWFDGTVAMNFTRNNADTLKQTWDFSVEADGSGGGTWSTTDASCDLSFNANKVRLRNCSDPALDGVTELPVTWPEF